MIVMNTGARMALRWWKERRRCSWSGLAPLFWIREARSPDCSIGSRCHRRFWNWGIEKLEGGFGRPIRSAGVPKTLAKSRSKNPDFAHRAKPRIRCSTIAAFLEQGSRRWRGKATMAKGLAYTSASRRQSKRLTTSVAN